MFAKKSVIGHKGLPFHCPHTADDMHIIFESLGAGALKKGPSFLDLGCGRGQLLSLLVERFSGHGLGIDTNAESLAAVRSPAGTGTIDTLCEDMTIWIEKNKEEKQMFDVIICVGSLREGQQDETIKALATFVNPFGFLIIGELVWVQEPSLYFLEFLGLKKNCYTSPEELLVLVQQSGFSRVHHQSLRSLEEYECTIHRNVEAWAASEDNKTDPDREKILELSTTWTKFSREHAWHTWNFDTIVAQKA